VPPIGLFKIHSDYLTPSLLLASGVGFLTTPRPHLSQMKKKFKMYLEGWGTKNFFLKNNLVVLYRNLSLLFKNNKPENECFL
jgi:hypothetical protein